ncbi:MAG: ABC transporter permease [Chloroflexota bacterium]
MRRLEGSEAMSAGAAGWESGRDAALPAPQARAATASGPPSGLPGWLPWLLPIPLLLLLALPLVALLWRGVAMGEPLPAGAWSALRQALALSLGTSLISMAVVVAAGTPLGWLVARRRFRGAGIVDVLIDLPVVLPPAVAGIALLLAFGRFGLAGQWLDRAGITLGFTTAAVVLAQVFVSAPFYVRAAAGAFARIDRDVEEMAADLGATPWRVLRTVTMPLALPGLLAGLALAWARALGEFGATIMFAGNFPGVTRTMPLAIYSAYGSGDLETAVALSIAGLAASAGVLAAVRRVGGRR